MRSPTILIPVLLAAVATAAASDDAPPSTEEIAAEAESVHAWTARVADEIELRARVGEGGEPVLLAKEEKALLKWSAPESGRIYGDVYVWTDRGRPLAVVSMFEWFHPWTGRTAEWSSLAERSIDADHGGAPMWRARPTEATWSPVADEGSPPASKAARLVRMRAIARRFTARMIDLRSDAAGVDRPLRLLTAPLYRYESPEEGVLDGGLFAFVLGSDPDVFLLVEARREPGAGTGPATWHCLLARMNDAELIVALDGEECRRFERVPREEKWDRTRPFCHQVVKVGETVP